MKRNITPFYIDGPVESVNCSQNQTISGKSSFVLVTGAPDGTPGNTTPTVLTLPVRTSDDRPIVPGTIVTVVRTATEPVPVIVGSADMLDVNVSSSLTVYSDSASFMFVGPTDNNVFGAWTLISSDLAAADWNGGSVTNATTFQDQVAFEGSSTILGSDSADLLKIKSRPYYTNSNDSNERPSVSGNSTGGTVDISDLSSQNAGVLTFTTGWSNSETADVTFPQSFPADSYYMIFKNQDQGVNGSITSISENGFTFTASGDCIGKLEYFVVVTGKG